MGGGVIVVGGIDFSVVVVGGGGVVVGIGKGLTSGIKKEASGKKGGGVAVGCVVLGGGSVVLATGGRFPHSQLWNGWVHGSTPSHPDFWRTVVVGNGRGVVVVIKAVVVTSTGGSKRFSSNLEAPVSLDSGVRSLGFCLHIQLWNG